MMLLLLPVAVHAAAAAIASVAHDTWDVARLMNGTNFGSHNIVAGGCDPVVTSAYKTAQLCQTACDGPSLPPPFCANDAQVIGTVVDILFVELEWNRIHII